MIRSNGSNQHELGPGVFGYSVGFHEPKRIEWVSGRPSFGSDVFHLRSLLLVDLFARSARFALALYSCSNVTPEVRSSLGLSSLCYARPLELTREYDG